MNTNKILFVILILSAFIAYLHTTALEYKLYFIYPWFDVLLHFLGGALVALIIFAAYLHKKKGHENRSLWSMLIWLGVLPALFVGVSWEIFELWAGVAPAENYAFDTSIDLLMDSIGGILAIYFAIDLSNKRDYQDENKNGENKN